ncbi:MAG: hypothetical protein MUO19_03310 [Dehalococcoidales bacterium]|nr:hypothetical protein [Dehalococcoidales bacterium]
MPPRLQARGIPIQRRDSGAELLDAADVEFDGAVGAAGQAGAVEEGERFGCVFVGTCLRQCPIGKQYTKR